MQILKQHYEKIALGFLLLILLIFSANMLYDLWSAQVIPSDGPPPPGGGERVARQLAEADFGAVEKLRQPDVEWAADYQDGAKSLFYPGRYMLCANQECDRWLPWKETECPWCGAAQLEEVGPKPTGTDTDQDGIADAVEEKYDFLDPNDERDAFLDSDNDWFTNLEEVGGPEEAPKTDPSDQASHPLLAHNLRLVSIRQEPFDIVFQDLITGGADAPKEQWDIALNVVENGVWRTKFVNLGDVVKGYEIVDVVRKAKEIFRRELGTTVQEDVSEVILQKEGEDPIVLVIGQRSTAGVRLRFVYYKSAHDPRKAQFYSVKANEMLTLTGAAGDVEQYSITLRRGGQVFVQLVGAEDAVVRVTREIPPKFRRRAAAFPERGPGTDEYDEIF